MNRSSIDGTVATMKTGTSIELASPETSDALKALLVSSPSVNTTIALRGLVWLSEAPRGRGRRV